MILAHLHVEFPVVGDARVELVLGARIELPQPPPDTALRQLHPTAYVAKPLAFWPYAGVEARTVIFANGRRGVEQLKLFLGASADVLVRLLRLSTNGDYHALTTDDGAIERITTFLAEQVGDPEFMRVTPQALLG